MAKKLSNVATFEFFDKYLEHKDQIEKYVYKLTSSTYPLGSEMDLEDLLYHVRDELARLDSFGRYDESRGSFNTYLFFQVRNIVGTLHRKNIRHARVLIRAEYLPEDSLDYSFTREESFDFVGRGKTQVREELDPELLEELESMLNKDEITLIKALAEEDIKGKDLYARMDRNAMFVSRMKKSLAAKIGKVLSEHIPGFTPGA